MDTAHLIALGVLAQLAFAAAHHFVKSPRQQAQLDNIEATVNGLMSTVTGSAGTPSGNVIPSGSATASTAGKETAS